MKIRSKTAIKLLWCFPLLAYAADANAWGLYTHLFFSQWLILSTPLVGTASLSSKIQAAMKKFPQLVLAGACLPDLAVISKAFHTTHLWDKAELMLNNAKTEQEIAIAIGYCSHLFVDVIAHNHFVPAHEASWKNKTVITHIASEWAMDAHIARQVQHCPHHLILTNIEVLTQFIAPNFGISPKLTKRKLRLLAWLDGLLRVTQLSPLILQFLKINDAEFVQNLNYYVAKTSHALDDFHHALKGIMPSWQPELKHLSAAELIDWRTQCLGDLRLRMLTPVDYYRSNLANQSD
jgi:Zinc dependent phospholipase C